MTMQMHAGWLLDVYKRQVWKCLLFIVLGGVCVVIGSQFVVNGATTIARSCGMSERFIGLTIVAFGTSLPELVTSVSAARKGNAGIAIGNIAVSYTHLGMDVDFSSLWTYIKIL